MSVIISILSLLLNILVAGRGFIDLRKTFELKQFEINYSYKLKCYSKIISFHSRKKFKDPQATKEELLFLIAEAQLLCNKETEFALVKLNKVSKANDLHSKEYIEAYHNCIQAMKEELNPPKFHHHRHTK